MRGEHMTLIFDPYLTPSARRSFPPPLTSDALDGIDYVFCTHAHGDHLDPVAIRGIAAASPGAQFVVPNAALAKLRECGVPDGRAVVAQVDEDVQLGPLTVHAVPAAHGDSAEPIAECVWEPDPEHGYRFIGYVVDCNGVRLYHAGDTTVYPGMVERLSALRVDVALIPINGRDWFRERQGIIGNTDHREAADLGHGVGADVIVPTHFDMFPGNPGFPGWFVDYCMTQYPGQGFHVPVRCKRWDYVKPAR